MSQEPAKEEVVRFGIASTAQIAADKVIPALKAAPQCVIVGVGSRSKERAEEFCQKHGAGKGLTMEELLTREDIDAIYVPLPSGLRNDFIAKAIKAGKHIYSEKPHSGSVKELKELIDACRAKNLQWMDGTMWYHSLRTQEVTSELKKIAPIRRAGASFTWQGPSQEWIDGGNGRTDKKREPYGMLGDSGHYPISASLFAFGWQLPTRVQALYWKLNKVDTVIECEAFLWFGDQGRAIIDTSCEIPHRSEIEIVGEKGSIRINDLVGGQGRSGNFKAYESPFVGSGEYTRGDATGKDEVVQVTKCDHVLELLKSFTKCVAEIRKGGKPVEDWPRRSLATHAVMVAIFASIEAGGKVVEVEKIDSE